MAQGAGRYSLEFERHCRDASPDHRLHAPREGREVSGLRARRGVGAVALNRTPPRARRGSEVEVCGIRRGILRPPDSMLHVLRALVAVPLVLVSAFTVGSCRNVGPPRTPARTDLGEIALRYLRTEGIEQQE